MKIITGPQGTDDEVEDLWEAAGLHGARPVVSPDVRWADVTELITLPGWEACSVAVADVMVAKAAEIPVRHVRSSAPKAA